VSFGKDGFWRYADLIDGKEMVLVLLDLLFVGMVMV